MTEHSIKINHACIPSAVSQDESEPSKSRHVPPGLISIGGLFKVFHCSQCGLVALSEDGRSSEPCWACGNSHTDQKKARWVSKRKWYNPLTWGDGYWRINA